jgi:hypothetical protein
LTDRVEERHADRIAALVELAKYRGVSLSGLMDHLGIHFPAHVCKAHSGRAAPPGC